MWIPKPLEVQTGAQKRFSERLIKFETDGKPNPELRHAALWLIHNCVAHPLLGLLPGQHTTELHELTSCWLNKFPVQDLDMVMAPTITDENRGWWLFHNLIAHVFIGVAPIQEAFDLHDWSATKMGVKGWV